MKDLSKHISNLLREHGYVIIPDFGGFVSQHMSSCISENGRVVSSPYSEIGFNENLKMNDGLLVQSYMTEDGISYPAAEKKILRISRELKETLYRDGELMLPDVGYFRLSMGGHLIFTACKDTLVDTNTFGLTSLDIPLLSELKKERAKSTRNEKQYKAKYNLWSYTQYAAACIVVIMLYFSSSVSIDNTSLYRYDNKASVMPAPSFVDDKKNSEFEVITEESTEETLPAVAENKSEENVSDARDVHEEEFETNINSKPGKYHIIIASLGAGDDVDAVVSKLKRDGYVNAGVIRGDGRIRVSIESFADYDEALNQSEKLRNTTKYKDAWVLTKK